MKPLSIGVDARPLAHPNTGIGRYTNEILSRITSSGHRFYLYGTEPLSYRYDGTIERIHDKPVRRLTSTFLAQQLFPRWARQDRLDVFWSPRHHLPLALRCPTVLTIHDLVWRAVPHTMAPFARQSERWLMAPSVRKAKHIIAVSHSTKDDLLAWIPALASKVQVIHEAACVSPADRAPSPSIRLPTTPYFLFVGTFEPRKNLHRLVRAFTSIAAEVPHDLVLVGSQGWGPSLEPAVDAAGAYASRVHRLQPVETADLAELYAHCEVFVYPSLYEGFGLPLVEAMGFGKPIITAANSSLREVAGDAAVYVSEYDEKGIASAMYNVATDQDARRRLSIRATARFMKFSWPRAAEETLAVLQAAGSSQTV